MKRAASPDIEPHIPHHEHPTPTKAKLQDAVEYGEYLNRNNLIYTKQRAFDFFNISQRSEQRILSQNNAEDSEQEAGEAARRGTHNSKSEGRDAKLKIQLSHIRRMKEIINSDDINHRALL